MNNLKLNYYNKIRKNYSKGEKYLLNAYFLKDENMLNLAKKYFGKVDTLIDECVKKANISQNEKERMLSLKSAIDNQLKVALGQINLYSSEISYDQFNKFDKLESTKAAESIAALSIDLKDTAENVADLLSKFR